MLKKIEVFLQVPSSQKRQRNQTIEFSWGLYCLVALFLLLYVICASVPKADPDLQIRGEPGLQKKFVLYI